MKSSEPQLFFLGGEEWIPKHDDAAHAQWIASLQRRPSRWRRFLHTLRKVTMTTTTPPAGPPDSTAADAMRMIAAAVTLRRTHKTELRVLEHDAAAAEAADAAAQGRLNEIRVQYAAVERGAPGDLAVLFELKASAEKTAIVARSVRDATAARVYAARIRHRSERWRQELDAVLGALREHLPPVMTALHHLAELTNDRLDECAGGDLETITGGLTAGTPGEVMRALRQHFAGRGYLGDGPAPRMSLVWPAAPQPDEHGITWR